jgi:hypothetical protein
MDMYRVERQVAICQAGRNLLYFLAAVLAVYCKGPQIPFHRATRHGNAFIRVHVRDCNAFTAVLVLARKAFFRRLLLFFLWNPLFQNGVQLDRINRLGQEVVEAVFQKHFLCAVNSIGGQGYNREAFVIRPISFQRPDA